jgi:hypothetical protein
VKETDQLPWAITAASSMILGNASDALRGAFQRELSNKALNALVLILSRKSNDYAEALGRDEFC